MNPKSACLIIHGFSGSLREIEYLRDYLHNKNIDTHTVLLPGHGGTKKDLKSSSHVDWILSVNRVLHELAQNYDRINLIGFSMGGLLSLCFATLPKINKIVTVNTPIRYVNLEVILKDMLNGDMRCVKASGKASLKSAIDFMKIVKTAKKESEAVCNQTLIIQCSNDICVRPGSAEYIKEKIGNCAKVQYYYGGCHLIFTKPGKLRDSICHDIFRYLTENNAGKKQKAAPKEPKEILAKGLESLSAGEELLSPFPNIHFSTMGGKIWWGSLAEFNGWRVQKNKLFKNYRILDSHNERIAWGNEKEVLESLLFMIEKKRDRLTS